MNILLACRCRILKFTLRTELLHRMAAKLPTETGSCDGMVSMGIPHGVFLVKRPKLSSTADGDIRSTQGDESFNGATLKEPQQVFASSSGSLPLVKAQDDVTEESAEIDKSHTNEPNATLLEHSSKVETEDAPVSTLNDNTQTLSIDHKDSSDSSIDNVQTCELNISTSQDVTVDDNETMTVDEDNEIHDEDVHSSDEDTSNPFSNLLLFSDSENDNPVTSKAAKRKEHKIKSKQKPKKPERRIPDSFVAVRFSSPEIKAKLQLAQQSMVESDKKLKPTLISLVKLHITLLTLQLSNETLIDKAKDCLRVSCGKIREEISQQEIVLTVRSLQSFGNRVVFAAIEDGPAKEVLANIAGIVRETFAANDLVGTDNKKFTPHLTIAKTTKTSGRKRVKKIEPASYEKHKDEVFGTQYVNSLELLSMTLPPDKQGYYHCFSRESFTSSNPLQSDGSIEIASDETNIVSDSSELLDDRNISPAKSDTVETTISDCKESSSSSNTVSDSTENGLHTNQVSDEKDTGMVETITDHSTGKADRTKNSKGIISDTSHAGDGDSIKMASVPFSAVRFTPRILTVRKEATKNTEDTADTRLTTDDQTSREDNTEETEHK
ncbi:A-kinase anchor protein 7-like [Dysidea avara]|uniref:A-kinase anchor protein 7-like n=1 Tax=Dysidea avara TaxID=196820 RepID=UPI00332322F0